LTGPFDSTLVRIPYILHPQQLMPKTDIRSILVRKFWIFDLDGTLTVPIHDFDAIRKTLGIPLGEDILKYITSREKTIAESMYRKLDEIEIELAEHTKPAEGVLELISILHHNNTQLGIITRNTKENACRSLKKIDLLPYFPNECILGRLQAPPKPDPEGIITLLDIWQTTPNQAVMVGDYKFDLQTGRSAGTATIHVGPSGKPRWPELTDIHVTSLQELVRMLVQPDDFLRYEN
jgi:HAD superfamily hydrolase (TIGR01509 family)